MPGPITDMVHSDAALPAKVDVVVIGAGIIGAATALELAERGLKVALCDKGSVGCEQSSRNMGWVRLSHRDPREMPLMMESVRLWQGLNARTGEESGYRQCSITYACASQATHDDMAHWVEYQKPFGIGARMFSAAEGLAAYPGISLNILGAMINPMDGRAEPQKASAAFARAAQRLGVTLHQNCAVRGIERSAGRLSAVITEKGRIGCDAAVLAGGAWSRLFLQNLGVELPQLRVKSSVLRTEPLPGGPEGTLKHSDFTFTKRLDGGYTVSGALATKYDITPDAIRLMKWFLPVLKNEWRSLNLSLNATFLREIGVARHWADDAITPFEKARILDPAPDADLTDPILDSIRKVYPFFAKARIAQRWAGQMDVLPDAIPVISAVEEIPGLIVSTGYSGHGFGIGPGAGRLTAEIVTGASTVVDAREFRLSRFTDGSRVAPISGITRRG